MPPAGIAASPDHPSAPVVPAVRRLRLHDFRNYRRLDLAVAGDVVVVTGPNGAGKTNLIEALSYLAPGRGLRNAGLAEVARATGRHAEAAAWSVLADLETAAGACRIATGAEPRPNHAAQGAAGVGGRRALLIDDRPARSLRELADQVRVVWLTPDMDQLFRSSADSRRRFIDRLVFGFDQQHAARVNAYTRAVAERARLLKGTNGAPDPNWLAAVEARIGEQGVAVAATRLDTVRRLNRALERGPDDALPAARVAVDGAVEGWLEEMPAIDAEERFRATLAADRAIDRRTGRTRTGPHRSDLIVRHLGHDRPAASCSTGEQKAVLVSLVLAYAESLLAEAGSAPLLLLDEAVAHLDAARREALFARLTRVAGQVWLTGTEAADFDKLNKLIQPGKSVKSAEFFAVDAGWIGQGA